MAESTFPLEKQGGKIEHLFAAAIDSQSDYLDNNL